jgi:hypothetical protein
MYDLIEQQFLAIQGFFVAIHLNLEIKDMPGGIDFILLKILGTFLKICGIATGYAKSNFFKRGSSNSQGQADLGSH